RSFEVQRFPLPTEQQLVALEDRLKTRLPDDYRRFILNYNGGLFTASEPVITPQHDGCPVDRLTGLWGIGASYRHAELGSDVDIFDDNDPPIIVPVGNTLMGNLLYLVNEDAPDRGSICLKMAFSWTIYVLTKDMDEFFGLLTADEPTR
ncbi:MAG TPA: SMI1/KNR4 family protein, partial [Gemmataceae bacterium]|nr:SMI1/KNR4 family protein [Gemmataceae bacterium]